MKSAASLAAVALLSGTTEAFWRMPCYSRTTLARLDPIVDPGKASSHGHAIHGGSNFAETTTYDMLRESTCTSCAFDDDKSAYWTPSLHFVHENGMTEVVPQIGGMLAYYLLLGEDIQPFPKDFQMLAGDPRLRNYTGPIPDKPLADWDDEDMTQEALTAKSIGMNCMNYGRKPEGSRYRHFLPDKEFLDENCADGIRAEMFFPSCWNGVDVDTEDHKSHMAYPTSIDGGKCPDTHPVRVPSLFYETIWRTSVFAGKPGQFTWSNGDPSGCGYHADFMNGWDIGVLGEAIEKCKNESGNVEDCSVFHTRGRLQSEHEQDQCDVQDMPAVLKHDDCAGPAKGLCGNVPIQYGPEYAAPIAPGAPGEKPTAKPVLSSVRPVASQSYAPARSEGPGGISKYEVNTSAVKPAPMPSKAADKDDAPAPPAITPAPAAPEVDNDGKIISTSTYTSNGMVYEVAIEEVEVVVTVTEDAAYKHRRHADAHKRRHHGIN